MCVRVCVMRAMRVMRAMCVDVRPAMAGALWRRSRTRAEGARARPDVCVAHRVVVWRAFGESAVAARCGAQRRRCASNRPASWSATVVWRRRHTGRRARAGVETLVAPTRRAKLLFALLWIGAPYGWRRLADRCRAPAPPPSPASVSVRSTYFGVRAAPVVCFRRRRRHNAQDDWRRTALAAMARIDAALAVLALLNFVQFLRDGR